MDDTPELDQVVEIRGIGRGYIAMFKGEFVVIGICDQHLELIVPRDHLGSDCYQLLDEMATPVTADTV